MSSSREEQRAAARGARVKAEESAAAAATRKRRLRMLGIAAGAAVIFVVIAIIVSSGGGGDDASSRAASAQTNAGTLPGERESSEMLEGIRQSGTTLGAADAPVKIVEYADLQCPICRDGALEVLPLLVRDYVRTGKAQIELRLIPIIDETDSVTAAHAGAAAAQQNRLFNFADIFFYNQGAERSGYVTESFVDRIYRAAGVDVDAAKSYADGAEAEAQLSDAIEAAQRDEVPGTPTYMVGKRDGALTQVQGIDYDSLRAAIDQQLG